MRKNEGLAARCEQVAHQRSPMRKPSFQGVAETDDERRRTDNLPRDMTKRLGENGRETTPKKLPVSRALNCALSERAVPSVC